MTKTKNDINVIVLENKVYESKQEIIDGYIEILKTCKTVDDFYTLFDVFYDDVLTLAAEKFVEMQISKNAEILEDIRNNIK